LETTIFRIGRESGNYPDTNLFYQIVFILPDFPKGLYGFPEWQ